MNPNQSTLDPQLYRETLSRLRLREIALRELHVTCENRIEGPITFHIGSNAQIERKDTELSILAGHTLHARNEKNSLFSINATYCLTLLCPEPLPEGFVEIYIANNLSLTVFPYFRELVNSTTSRMGLPPLTLPYVFNQSAPPPTKPPAKPRTKKTAK